MRATSDAVGVMPYISAIEAINSIHLYMNKGARVSVASLRAKAPMPLVRLRGKVLVSKNVQRSLQ